jgi:hypothetical protein
MKAAITKAMTRYMARMTVGAGGRKDGIRCGTLGPLYFGGIFVEGVVDASSMRAIHATHPGS